MATRRPHPALIIQAHRCRKWQLAGVRKVVEGRGPDGQAGAMTLDSDRERLGNTFDQAAGCYQRARPDYPVELFDDLITVAGLVSGDRLLEVGCATGKATL